MCSQVCVPWEPSPRARRNQAGEQLVLRIWFAGRMEQLSRQCLAFRYFVAYSWLFLATRKPIYLHGLLPTNKPPLPKWGGNLLPLEEAAGNRGKYVPCWGWVEFLGKTNKHPPEATESELGPDSGLNFNMNLPDSPACLALPKYSQASRRLLLTALLGPSPGRPCKSWDER